MDNRKEKRDKHGLCFRCEHRAQYYETGLSPRMECGEPETCKYTCYMYKPVRPVVVKAQDPDDPRPLFGPAMIASRVRYDRTANYKDCEAQLFNVGDGEYMVTWVGLDKQD